MHSMLGGSNYPVYVSSLVIEEIKRIFKASEINK